AIPHNIKAFGFRFLKILPLRRFNYACYRFRAATALGASCSLLARQLSQIAASLEPLPDDCGDPGCGVAVAEWKGRPCHRQPLGRILEQPPDLGDDAIGGRADKAGVAARDGFGALGLLAQDE